MIGDQTLHATGYAMGIQRDGAVRGRRRSRHRLLRRRRHQPGGRQRGVRLCLGLQRAGGVLLPEQPVGDLRAAGAAEPHPAVLAGPGFGFPGLRVDGNDVLACFAVTRKAMQAAREGQGPTLIEAFTYRMGAHTTTDDPTRYRLAGELEAWKLRGPDRAGPGLPGPAPAGRAPTSSATWTPRRQQVGARLREACRTMPDPPAAGHLRQRLRRAEPRSLRGRARAVRRLPRTRFAARRRR